jgi:hypothetical protein
VEEAIKQAIEQCALAAGVIEPRRRGTSKRLLPASRSWSKSLMRLRPCPFLIRDRYRK